MTLDAHLQISLARWWLKLGLPMILGRPPINIDSEYAWELLLDFYCKCDETVLRGVTTDILREVAKRSDIDGTRRMKKADLIQAILRRQHALT